METVKPLLRVRDLVVEFKTDKGTVRAVNGISFDIMPGETLGIVGESGCGKSVTSLAILGLIPSPPGKVVSGSIAFDGLDLTKLSKKEFQAIRGKDVSMIFQEPMTALNPVLQVGTQMKDVIKRHQKIGEKESHKRALQMLETVGIPAPEARINEYPHQLSGGMRQRIMIAMALSCGPKLLLADEPTTALDVTTQAQVMSEMKRLQREFGMAVALVTHDLGVIAQVCERVVVMYCGEIIEEGPVMAIFKQPRHPYTAGLLRSVPFVRDRKIDRLPTIEGVVPDLLDLPKGCRFADRCPNVQDKCRKKIPKMTAKIGPTTFACFFPIQGGEA